ncbi:MAG TPA: VanW family protein [Fimbriimonadaceae bacterium]|nr:VanW family protein [Fimbriimonadaceae bacterium]
MKLKKVALWIGGPVIVLSAAACVLAARYVPTIKPNTFVGSIEIGNLTPEEAAKKVREWWYSVKAKPLKVTLKDHDLGIGELTPSQLDTTIDDAASVAGAPLDTAITSTEHLIGQGDTAKTTLELKFKSAGVKLPKLENAVHAASNPRPAKFAYSDGQVYVKPEVAGYKLDQAALPPVVGKAVQDGTAVNLPVVDSPHQISDAELAGITDLVSSFTTHFPYRANRVNNIRVASGRLSGIFLRPGDRMSFNTIVGRRTIEGGFKDAPVYKNGKHDHGVGGGICQVSTTLYNACLLGDLKIVQRFNHSLPVPYVPLGRDATVDYGSRDLIVENSYKTPIVVISAFREGTLTFRVLGKRDPDLEVKIERTGETSFGGPVQYITDKTLPPGKTKVIEKGSTGHAVTTFRLVYKGGKLVAREPLGRSYYIPAKRIVARGPAAPVVAPGPVTATPGTPPPGSVPPPAGP